MTPYLKSRQHYLDQYDKHTVSQCRSWLATKLPEEQYEEEAKKKEGVSVDMVKSARAAADHWYIYMHTGERFLKKEETVKEWMQRDEECDRFLETTQAPDNIICGTCGRLMFVCSKHLNIGFEGKPNTVLFMYECPLEHIPRRAFYNTGEEFRRKPTLCSKCETPVTEVEKDTKKKFVTILTCPKCKHVERQEIERVATLEEKKDPDYEKDRARFCISDEEGQKFLEFKLSMNSVHELLEKHKERESEKEVYDAVAELKKLKIIELEELLRPVLEKAGYIKLQFKSPEITKDVVVPFVVYESRSDREDRVSTHDLEKLLRQTLRPTNWRLMTDGTSYRLGMLEGRLRGYDREEDLVQLVKQEGKRLSKLKSKEE